MGFWGSLFGGSSKELNGLINQFGQTGTNQVGQGQSNENKASDFFSSILSGDSSKQMQALSPEVSAAKKSAQEQNKSTAEFGTRSGGNAASTATTNDRVHSDITNLIGSLTNSSASSLASLGSSQVGQGLDALGQEQGAVQQRIQNWQSSILGKSTTSAVAAGESYLLGNPGGVVSSIFGGKQGGQDNSGEGTPFSGGGSESTFGS